MTRYEALRGLVTGASPGPHPPRGLALFLRRGVAEWMRAWPRSAQEIRAREPVPPHIECPSHGPASSREIVLLLAEMAMQAAGR